MSANAQPRPQAQAVRSAYAAVTPIARVRSLPRLITPPGALVLEPSCASGSAGIPVVLEDRRGLAVKRAPAHRQIDRACVHHPQPAGR